MRRVKLDQIDLQILRNLQDDGRITNVELARRAGISAPPCLRRVRALEEAGFITGYRETTTDTFCLNYQHKNNWFCAGSMARIAYQLLLFSDRGELIERLGGAAGVPAGMQAVGITPRGTLAIHAAHGYYQTDDMFLEWSETDTLDAEGEVIREAPVPSLTMTSIKAIAEQFIGIVPQVPPRYSAIKRGGEALYRLARRGEEMWEGLWGFSRMQ